MSTLHKGSTAKTRNKADHLFWLPGQLPDIPKVTAVFKWEKTERWLPRPLGGKDSSQGPGLEPPQLLKPEVESGFLKRIKLSSALS